MGLTFETWDFLYGDSDQEFRDLDPNEESDLPDRFYALCDNFQKPDDEKAVFYQCAPKQLLEVKDKECPKCVAIEKTLDGTVNPFYPRLLPLLFYQYPNGHHHPILKKLSLIHI